jgi:hypothetical protein
MVRYRRLAMLETDPTKAQLLNQLADEADRGVLCTIGRMSGQAASPTPQSTKPQS